MTFGILGHFQDITGVTVKSPPRRFPNIIVWLLSINWVTDKVGNISTLSIDSGVDEGITYVINVKLHKNSISQDYLILSILTNILYVQ